MRSRLLHQPARLAGASLLRLQSDDRLADLAVAGHETAFAAIVQRYRAPLMRYCAGIVGPDRAEDAVQQVLINAHLALTTSSDVRHLRAWLFKIAHNTALNTLRAVRDDLPLDPAHMLTADGPEATLERRERLRATLAAVDRLPERQRAALLLRELEGRSHDEIADALGVSSGAARQHLMRARAAVRGAVTAITPYPIVARIAEAMTAGPAPWADAVAGAGAGATIAKLTAGVAATGALVGGVVGTNHVVKPREPAASARGGAATVRDHEVARTSPVAAATIVPVAAAWGGSAVSEPEIHRTRGQSGDGGKSSGHGGRSGGSSGRDDDEHAGGRGQTSRGRGGDNGEPTGTSGRGEDDHHGTSGRGDRERRGTSGGSDDEQDLVTSPTRKAGSGTSGSGRREDDSSSEDSSGSGSGHEPDDSGSSGPGSGTPTVPDDPPEAPSPSSGSGRGGGDAAAPSGGGSSGPGSGQAPSDTVPPDEN